MTEINKLEKEFENFLKDIDYSIDDDDRSGKKYVVHSENLKNSLRDIIYSGANADEWQISYGFGQDGIDYLAERDGKFAIYRKAVAEDSPDEFSVLDTAKKRDNSSQVWQRREEFLRSVRNIENSKRIVKESSLRNELRNQTDSQGDKFGKKDYVAYSAGNDEEGNRIIKKRSNSDLKGGYGYNLANEIVSTLSKSPGNVFFQPESGRLDITSPEIISAEIAIVKDDDQKKIQERLEDVKGENFTQHQLSLPK